MKHLASKKINNVKSDVQGQGCSRCGFSCTGTCTGMCADTCVLGLVLATATISAAAALYFKGVHIILT